MYMYTNIIGDKSHVSDKYQVDYNTFISQMEFERVLLYTLLDTNGGLVVCRDQSRYMVRWFNKRSEIWL